MPDTRIKISIILPARDESSALSELLPVLDALGNNYEVILVDDGSVDGTAGLCSRYEKIKTIHHAYPKGNGAAVKSGARAATGDVLVFMDADGQHDPTNIPKLVDELNKGYDMVIGARNFRSHANSFRMLANIFYNQFATWITSHKVWDLTSGFRAAKADKFREFLFLLPNGFSYPTTITMAFFRAGYSVTFMPMDVGRRIGKSHIKPAQDGIRFLLIIFKIGTLYTPLKFFFPISLIFFVSGAGYYAYTFLTQGRFTNMSALLIITSILVFLIGLVSEQLTMLFYRDKN